MGYLHHILSRDSIELINRVYCAQKRRPVKDDWYLTIQTDLADLDIDLSEDQIKSMNKLYYVFFYISLLYRLARPSFNIQSHKRRFKSL